MIDKPDWDSFDTWEVGKLKNESDEILSKILIMLETAESLGETRYSFRMGSIKTLGSKDSGLDAITGDVINKLRSLDYRVIKRVGDLLTVSWGHL